MTWYTRPHRTEEPSTGGICPTLFFHKWHAYDGPSLETKESRKTFLQRIAEAVDDVARSRTYRSWYERYRDGLVALEVETVTARTVGRFVAGMATNPALESGVELHHLLGVPCLPGSAVKGLLHHVAEMELSEMPGLADGTILEDTPKLEDLLRRAEAIRRLFGSLAVEPAVDTKDGDGRKLGSETVRSRLLAWRRQGRIPEASRERVDRLLDAHTGGRLVCYDALPIPGQGDLLELDVLNPHYPLYYRSEGDTVPSDDQDPVPVYFPVVRAGARFSLSWRLRATSGDEMEQGEDSDRELIQGWFGFALGAWGAGGKTAAGYGYFEVESPSGRGRDTARRTSAGKRDERAPDPEESNRFVWRGVRLIWVPNEGLLEARLEGKRAHTRGQELLEQLPAEVRQRLTRKKNRKTLVCDVEVIQQSAEWYDLVKIRYSPEES